MTSWPKRNPLHKRALPDAEQLNAGSWWRQRTDPTDSRFALIQMRIPTDTMPTAQYAGRDAGQRLFEFCTNVLDGFRAARAKLEKGR